METKIVDKKIWDGLVKLHEIVFDFVWKHQISCAEMIWDSDSISEDSYSLIYDLCENIGYYEYPEDEE